MRKKLKKLAAIGVGMVLAGIMVCIISGIFGGTLGAFRTNSHGWDFVPFHWVPFITEVIQEDSVTTEVIEEGNAQEYCYTDSNSKQISRENVRSVDLNVNGCILQIVPGKADQTNAVLELPKELSHKNIKEKFDEKEGEWEIEIDVKNHHRNNPSYIVRLVLPPNLLELSTEVNAGRVEMEKISANKLDINVNMGDVVLDSISANESHFETNMGNIDGTVTLNGEVEIDSSMGNIQLQVKNKTEYGYKIHNEMGTVTIDEAKYEGVLKDMKVNTQAPLVFDIECSMGSVIIDFE